MRHRQHGPARGREQGAALLFLMLLVFLAATSWVIRHTDGGADSGGRGGLDRTTSNALAQAKEALIGRAAVDDNRPGSLPCPDTDNDGDSEIFTGVHCRAYAGRLPWKTLDLPEVLDGNGERLWYALSANLRDHPNAQPINVQQVPQLSLDGTPNIAAIVFSAGSSLAGQNGRPSNALTDYLDGSNGDGDSAYVAGPHSPTFNDTALAITRDDLFRTVNRRVLAEVRGSAATSGLRRYRAEQGAFPWADSGSDGFADNGEPAGKLPYRELSMTTAQAWLTDNAWLPLITYQRLSADLARIAIGNITLDVVP